jgi:hypothetical protein
MEALKMEKPMDSWNDDRLDELNRRVDEGFSRVDQRFEQFNREMKEGFTRVDREMKEGFAEIRGEMRYLGERFDRLLHTLIVVALGFAGTVFAALASLIVFLL